MFDSFSTKLDKALHRLKGHGSITEVNVAETLKEVRRAMLDADVNYKIAKDFTNRVKEKAIGQDVLTTLKPGQRQLCEALSIGLGESSISRQGHGEQEDYARDPSHAGRFQPSPLLSRLRENQWAGTDLRAVRGSAFRSGSPCFAKATQDFIARLPEGGFSQ